ncbi:MAG: 3-methyl-2-oxobutanoate hydroxymethyltransferase, partial [Candidatus Omnitrophica bacterium]|nr:3-methyl-2-oxobutanoate hydroxymethyltransferase [Candidatus Omnitrophota bacterium]
GKDAETANRLLDSALKLQEAGCFSIVLECIPDEIAKLITEKLTIPTIGIGAGIDCDGQVLVTHDMLGLFERFTPKFVKQYTNLSPEIFKAISRYKEEVENLKFPSKEHTFQIKSEELRKIKGK